MLGLDMIASSDRLPMPVSSSVWPPLGLAGHGKVRDLVWLVDYSPGYAIARRLHKFFEGFRVPAPLTVRMVDMELDVDSLMGLLLDSWPFGCFLKGYMYTGHSCFTGPRMSWAQSSSSPWPAVLATPSAC